MKVSKAWELSKGSGEKIGHPDTGYSVHVDLDNEALEKDKKNNFIEADQLPIDPLPPRTILAHPGHGTSTGSVIISRGDMTDSPPTNTEGGTTGPGKVTGVACEAELVPYRAIKSVSRFTYGNIEKAIYKAVNDGCSVISLSLGGVGHNALNAAMEYAIGKNVIIIAAAGNVPGISVVYPAKYPYCIAVAANNINDKPWKGSTYGKEVTISAPGESVWRAFRSKPDEDTKIVEPSCGTSYSTASTAGVAALWLSHHKREKLIKQFDSDTKLQFVFKNLLKKNARRPNGWEAKKYGAGIVNAGKLLKADPDSVRKDSVDDYSDFKKRKRRAAEDNLTAVEQMFEQLRAF
jgi:serine protease